MGAVALSPAHVMALAVVARAMRDARGPWWIIAGAAVALHGCTPVRVDDIDVLFSEIDVPMVAAIDGVRPVESTRNDRFRSRFYAASHVDRIPVEWMADFHVRAGTTWHRILPRSREALTVEGVTIFVPDRDELIAMLALFDRPKDRERIALLRR